jgi:hypothetical protein
MIKRHLKKFLLFILIVVSGIACEKDGSGHFKPDNAMYFTLQTGAQTYSTFGYTNTQVPDMFGGPEISSYYVTDTAGIGKTQMLLVVTEKITSGINTVEFTMGNCYVDWYMARTGNSVLGNYKEVIGQFTSNVLKLNGTTTYYLDKSGLDLSIVKQDMHNGRNTLEGTFTAVLRPAADTIKSQPASGSFRAYIK